MTEAEARRRFGAARVAVLGTVGTGSAPHLVPVTFVLDGDTVWTAVDAKPKRSRQLHRHANIRTNPRVCLLVQHWAEDWSRLWWVRADGTAVVTDSPTAVDRAAVLLRRKYAQYGEVGGGAPSPGQPGAPVIEIAVEVWRGWAAAPTSER